jgi:signal transduction histidine kinase
MTTPGKVAIWFGFGSALSGVAGAFWAGHRPGLTLPLRVAPGDLPILLILGGLLLIGLGIRREARRRDGIEANLLRSEESLRTAVSALEESEAQLQQAQKMEAVGRLAGGIAHDFNNLLTAIKGRTELLLSDGREMDQLESDLTEIRGAAVRAAALTRQLLAFSRRQILEPKVLDLNQIVREIETMLRRLIGEDIILVTRLEENLGSIQADPGHIEQVLMNLMVNARDAMPEGGAITIETANLHLDRRAAQQEGVSEPGAYILLQVSDTGSGVPAELRERIFEPFFTTKEQGKGTGLGLSMIWGIVKQSGGHIRVENVGGKGAQFRILLPRGVEVEATTAPSTASPVPATGDETILLVEDEAAVRSLVRRVLERRGYLVLEATNGAEAIQIVESYPERIDLILTDVVMPDITGPALVEILAPRLRDLRVLFMSGYTDQEIIRRGVDEFHAGFIGKPFSPDELGLKVREVLDAELPGVPA